MPSLIPRTEAVMQVLAVLHVHIFPELHVNVF